MSTAVTVNGTESFEAEGVKYKVESHECGVNRCAEYKAIYEGNFRDLKNYECEQTFCPTDLCNTGLAAKLSTILLHARRNCRDHRRTSLDQVVPR